MQRTAFTLVELAIVLVIIGLIVGGVLVGRDLIKQGETRAQITQLEKYSTATRAFHTKYGGLPGDLFFTKAAQFGFTLGTNCSGGRGGRDGDGIIEGNISPFLLGQFTGENGLYWQDISKGGLIEGVFPNSGAPTIDCYIGNTITLTAGTAYVGDYLPAGKIGYGTFVHVYPDGGKNWFGLAVVTGATSGNISDTVGIPVLQSRDIDTKLDDGIANTGNVLARFISSGNSVSFSNAPNAATDSASTCYNSTTGNYSVSINGGEGRNCALSVRMQ